MNEIVESFEERLKYAMALRGKRQIDICKHFGWSRSTVSQYCDPKCTCRPKSDRTYMLAEYLNVNPVWLMGYDTPMNGMSERDKLVHMVGDMDNKTLSCILAYAEGVLAAKNENEQGNKKQV